MARGKKKLGARQFFGNDKLKPTGRKLPSQSRPVSAKKASQHSIS